MNLIEILIGRSVIYLSALETSLNKSHPAASTRLVNVNIGSIETAKLDIELKYLNLMSQIYTTNIISERLFERRRNVSISRMISKILELLFENKHSLQKRKSILHNDSCMFTEVDYILTVLSKCH